MISATRTVDRILPGNRTTDESFIVERIYEAVMDQRLAPATKLGEHNLCRAFGVGRMRVRRALLLLADRGIIDLESNRGAFVASPSPKSAREVFDARGVLEPTIVRNVVRDISAEHLNMLRQHIALESDARDNDRAADLIRLTGEFHVKLALVSGNSILNRMVHELVTRSSLIVGLFGASNHAGCPVDEHSGILSAIERRDADRAAALMQEHLDHIWNGLNISAPRPPEGDLAEILGLD